ARIPRSLPPFAERQGRCLHTAEPARAMRSSAIAAPGESSKLQSARFALPEPALQFQSNSKGARPQVLQCRTAIPAGTTHVWQHERITQAANLQRTTLRFEFRPG